MATAPEKLLLRLEWKVVRRLDGRLQGAHRTTYRGAGIDFTGLRAYQEGDDARHIDWNVTARLDEPHLRVFTEDRELTVWLVLDRSASMAAGRPGRGKHDVLAELALVLARLFGRGGNRVGALLYDTGTPPRTGRRHDTSHGAGMVRIVPPGTTRRHALRIAAELERTSEARGGATTDLAEMLDAAGRLARRRALVVVLSDFIGDGDWERALQRLARRHEVVALRIVDTADDVLPEAGLIVVEDAETGEQLVVDSADPLLRVRFREAVDARDARLAAGMRRAGVPVHRVDTDRDLAEALVEVVARTRDRSP
ncbi:unnamed protein product [[Actinomadura] parvosata subsp. kistnae]|uniref:ATPase n=1 Tax=[Actinomadura] parvosata subsp. kistnae TaxID=1909395 RepID=A0A1V0AE58_9ACTN|nr:DUF58 domain-containing protein [Nonomuraea sp. ATCC 55076]AQZ68511.1 ATPase [Nonomuraea sp. ATCC 55076]SPL93030.1 unnamed protein product [Actinomadura parvosata subsp. kistnae]